jgi:hypothetical protein
MSEQFTYCPNARLSFPQFHTQAFLIPFKLQECHSIFITNSTNGCSAKRLNLNGDLNIFYGFQIPGFDTLKTGLAGPILASLACKFVPLKPATFYLVPDRNILHLLCIRTSGSFKSPVFDQFSEHERFEHQTDHSKKQMNCMCIGTINDLT